MQRAWMNHRISKPFLATVASLLLLTLLFWLADSPFSHAQTDPVFAGAGDIATCSADHDEMTANLLDTITGTVFNLGDSVYEDASLQDFNDCYGPSWGRHKARTKPVPGNHDYVASGASGYFTY